MFRIVCQVVRFPAVVVMVVKLSGNDLAAVNGLTGVIAEGVGGVEVVGEFGDPFVVFTEPANPASLELRIRLSRIDFRLNLCWLRL